MLTDKVDTTRRGIYIACLSIEMLDKATSYKFYIHLYIINKVNN